MPGLARRGQAGWQAWWAKRHPRCAAWELTQRNVYIVPTGAGWLYALLLAALLLGSINYQLNLGHLLTFALASAGVVAMHATHATLRGLRLSLIDSGANPNNPDHPGSTVEAGDAGLAAPLAAPLAAGHAGKPITLTLQLADPVRRGALMRALFLGRHGIGLRWQFSGEALARFEQADAAAATGWVDVPTGRVGLAPLQLTPQRRGCVALPALRIETRFPLGLLRAWSVWRPAGTLMAWPAAEVDAPPLPDAIPVDPDAARAHEPAPQPVHSPDTPPEADGARPWRRGDRPSQVLWRLSAQALARQGEVAAGELNDADDVAVAADTRHGTFHNALVVRDLRPPAASDPHPLDPITLRWADCASLPAEARLSRLCAWVGLAEQAARPYALQLPGRSVAAGRGEAHRRACLDALATWGDVQAVPR